MDEVVYIGLVLFLAALVASSIGFGDALLAMPLLALVLPITVATPVVGLSSCLIALLIAATAWRSVDLRAAAGLLVSGLLGVPMGVVFLVRAPEAVVSTLLGLSLVAYGLYRALGPALPALRSERWALPFGLTAGALGSAFNVVGPPAVVYGAMRRWPPAEFRATLQAIFLPVTAAVLVAHALGGLWTARVLTAFAWSTPGLVIGTAVGAVLHRKVPAARFRSILDWALVLLGILLVGQAIT